MSKFNSLLVLLSDGKAHLASHLAARLEISEVALSQMLEQFQADGLDIDVAEEISWRHPVIALESARIFDAMAADFVPQVILEYQQDSTNQTLQNNFSHGKVCLAEIQRAGRGRLGRSWFSPAASNIYLSLGWKFDLPVSQLGGLSLAVGMKLVESLRPFVDTAKLAVKWPNDVYLDDRKLAGVLIESKVVSEQCTEVVIGIGVNVLMQSASKPLDQPWASLSQYSSIRNRNKLVAAILDEMLNLLITHSSEQIDRYVQASWSKFDLLLNRPVSVMTNDQRIDGQGAGIDDDNNFLLSTSEGMQAFCSGDVSLRLAGGRSA